MSYDVWLEVDTGGPEPVEVWERNHTSNTAGMWRGAGLDLGGCDGRQAAQVVEGVAAAVEVMERDPERFRAMNPPNGWGSYESCLAFLTAIRDACVAHPATTVRISR